MVDPIKLPIPTPPPNADAHARADTERNRRLFDWAEAVLKALGLDKAVAAARSIEDLRRIALDVDSAEIALALRDALHPASGQRQEHFRGLKEGSLKVILRNRFADMEEGSRSDIAAGQSAEVGLDRSAYSRQGRQDSPHSCELDLDPAGSPEVEGRARLRRVQRARGDQTTPALGREPPDSPWS